MQVLSFRVDCAQFFTVYTNNDMMYVYSACASTLMQYIVAKSTSESSLSTGEVLCNCSAIISEQIVTFFQKWLKIWNRICGDDHLNLF